MSQAATVDLDVVPLDDGPVGGSERRARRPPRARRRRWPWIVAAAGVTAAVVAFPVRVRLAQSQLGRLEARWNDALALEQERTTAIARLSGAATTGDGPRVQAATDALDEELAVRFDDLAARVRRERVLDRGVRGLADAEHAELASAARALRGHRYDHLDARRVVDADLERQRARWPHADAASSRRRPPPLRSADAAIAALSRWSDLPTGSLLLTSFNRGLAAFDIDHSEVRPIEPRVEADDVVARAGFVVVLVDASAEIVRLDGTRVTKLTSVGDADSIFPAARPDAFWIVQSDLTAQRRPGKPPLLALEIDGNGNQIARWQPPPGSDGANDDRLEPVAEMDAGLLVFGPSPTGTTDLQMDHLDGSRGPSLHDAGYPFTADRSRVAWVDSTTSARQLHVWTPAAAADRVIANPPGRQVAGVGEFSPDGHRVAVFYSRPDVSPMLELGIVSLDATATATANSNGAVTVVGEVGPALPEWTSWSPDGRFVFLGRRDQHPLIAYRIGDPALHVLRATSIELGRFAVVAAGP